MRSLRIQKRGKFRALVAVLRIGGARLVNQSAALCICAACQISLNGDPSFTEQNAGFPKLGVPFLRFPKVRAAALWGAFNHLEMGAF